MSSLRNARKTQRVHQERHQPKARQHLGPLEKKKDYKKRAKDQERKKEYVRVLRQKALNKNPDEFHFHMVRSGLKDGVHVEKVKDEELVISNVRQDLTYITHQRTKERKKIEKLKAQLHLLDADTKPQNSHVLFVDDEEEAKTADPAKILDTHPKLLDRPVNRLTSKQLATLSREFSDPNIVQKIGKTNMKSYRLLAERLKREQKLQIMQEKLEVRQQLMKNKAKDGDKPQLVTEGSATAAPLYKWPAIRQK